MSSSAFYIPLDPEFEQKGKKILRKSKSDDEIDNSRLERTLSLTISEVKNLLIPSRIFGDLNHMGIFIIVLIDAEETFRTRIKEKEGDNPFFGEEFACAIPRYFHNITICVCGNGCRLFDQRAVRIAQVTISRLQLKNAEYKNKWFYLFPSISESISQGQANIQLQLIEKIVDSKTSGILRAHLTECLDFALPPGMKTIDPYCIVHLEIPQTLWKSESLRTPSLKGTLNPKFNTGFTFTIEDISFKGSIIVKFSFWIQSRSPGKDIFCGQVSIPLQVLDIGGSHQAWYLLGPKADYDLDQNNTMGTIRASIVYKEEYILSIEYYQELSQLLVEALDTNEYSSSLIKVFDDIIQNKNELIEPLLNIYANENRIIDFFSLIINNDLKEVSDHNTVFRGNSLSSRAVDHYMKLVGKPYLCYLIEDIIEEIYQAGKSCEIDPNRILPGESVDVNCKNLENYLTRILENIVYSSNLCPNSLCRVLSLIRNYSIQKFHENADIVKYTSVTAFIILRFIAPAILNPKLFGLYPDHPSGNTARTLLLISKCIQSLGNFVSSNSTKTKENFMLKINSTLITKNNLDAIKTYIEEISSSYTGLKNADPGVIIKAGYMVKRAQARSKFGLKNFKKRYITLTRRGISYLKSEGSAESLCFIPIEDILAIERVDEAAFSMPRMIQVVQTKRILYLQALNSVEYIDWFGTLRKVCKQKSDNLATYHSGAFISGSWTCCSISAEGACGCCRRLLNIDRGEAITLTSINLYYQRIFKKLNSNKEQLKAVIDTILMSKSKANTIVQNIDKYHLSLQLNSSLSLHNKLIHSTSLPNSPIEIPTSNIMRANSINVNYTAKINTITEAPYSSNYLENDKQHHDQQQLQPQMNSNNKDNIGINDKAFVICTSKEETINENMICGEETLLSFDENEDALYKEESDLNIAIQRLLYILEDLNKHHKLAQIARRPAFGKRGSRHFPIAYDQNETLDAFTYSS